MQSYKTILSTKHIAANLLSVYDNDVHIDCIPFIQTIAYSKDALQTKFQLVKEKKITAIFTSVNAVLTIHDSTVSDALYHIYCIEGNTQKSICPVGGNLIIKGTASNAASLADIIINDKPEYPVYFFCGDKRLNTLPNKLKQAGINCIEIPVYETKYTPQLIEKEYDGILFFSPSAVQSFFSVNRLPAHTVVFAIGETTAMTVKEYSSNHLVISKEANAELLLNEAVRIVEKHIKTKS